MNAWTGELYEVTLGLRTLAERSNHDIFEQGLQIRVKRPEGVVGSWERAMASLRGDAKRERANQESLHKQPALSATGGGLAVNRGWISELIRPAREVAHILCASTILIRVTLDYLALAGFLQCHIAFRVTR